MGRSFPFLSGTAPTIVTYPGERFIKNVSCVLNSYKAVDLSLLGCFTAVSISLDDGDGKFDLDHNEFYKQQRQFQRRMAGFLNIRLAINNLFH